MKVFLRNSAWLGNIDTFLKSLDLSNPENLEVDGNPKWISVHPVVLAMVAALGLNLTPEHIRCGEFTAKSKHYLERMELFALLRKSSGMKFTSHDSSGRFIPLRQIRNSKELTSFLQEVIPLLHLTPEKTRPIEYVLQELIQNVLDHSYCPNGAVVAAQYYPEPKNCIRIGIVDTGIGITKSISNSYSPQNDLDAIKLALTPGVTGTTREPGGSEWNAGAGLFFSKSIAYVSRSHFVIYSGRAMYKLLKSPPQRAALHGDPFEDRHSKADNYPSWKGTVVGIDVNLKENLDFDKLMARLREARMSKKRELKKQAIRRPQFI